MAAVTMTVLAVVAAAVDGGSKEGRPLLTAVVIDRGGGGMEPMAPMGASSTAVAVDGGGSNGIVPATIDNNDNTMA